MRTLGLRSKFLFFVMLLVFIGDVEAQTTETPAWMKHVAAPEITKKGFLESQKVLDPFSISTIRIQMSEADYRSLISDKNSDTYRLATMTYESPNIPLQTIEQVGIRLRGAAARSSAKKSFKISFEEFGNADREFFNLSKLNLNCDFQDPHLMRAKTCTDLFRRMGVPAARVGYAKLYINDDYRGLFANSEDIDKTFLNAYFESNEGNLYKCPGGASMQNGAGGYELQTNKDASDYSDILGFIKVLNNTPSNKFKKEIEKVLNVDELLMYVATNVLLGAWDDYWVLVKNFYFYHNPYSDLFNYIPHDFDGSLGTDWYHGNIAHGNVYNWSPNSGRPMVENLLAVPEYRKKYTHYLMLLCMWPFSLEAMEPEIDRTADMIRETLINDPYWGWRQSDFDDAFEHAIPGGNVKYGMKEYINLRRNSALQQLESVGPFIKELKREPVLVQENDAVNFAHLAVDQFGVNSVTLFYRVSGSVNHIEMFDDGAGVDEAANDFVYSAHIPSLPESGTIEYYVRAINNKGRPTRYPADNEWNTFEINYQPPELKINELLAQNDSQFKDNYGEYNDWFEIYNPTNKLFDLQGMFVSDDFTDPRKWRLGALSIPPKGFLLLWADDDVEQGSNHVGFKLSGGGEQLGLFDKDENGNVAIDTLSFGPQVLDVSYGRTEDGAEDWIFFNDPTPGRGNRDSTAIIEDLIDITNLGGAVSEPNDDSPSDETIANIIDNNLETKYLTFIDTTWVMFYLPEPSLVSGYAIYSANDHPERDPANWEFQGYDQETKQWTTLHSVANEPPWQDRFQMKQFIFSNDKRYLSYRLNIHSANGGGIIQMAELEIYGDVVIETVDITDQMGEVLEPHDDSPVAETIENIIDNDVTTKYLTFSEHTWVEYRHPEKALVNGYAIVSANDVPDRDPRDWEFQGWDEATSSWVTLHTVTNEPQWPQRFFKKKFSFMPTDAYSRFRLDITSGHGVDIIQMAELEIYSIVMDAVKEKESTNPSEYALRQNYPNPFNPTTTIQFSLPQSAHITLTIFNVLGQNVKTLIDQPMNPGLHRIRWGGTNEAGALVTNSVYFYRLESELGVQTKKMMLLR